MSVGYHPVGLIGYFVNLIDQQGRRKTSANRNLNNINYLSNLFGVFVEKSPSRQCLILR